MKKKYVQYGCGLSAPAEWINFDASPTLRMQKVPLIGSLIKNNLNTVFPKNVIYGDIIKGLPLSKSSCSAIFCSHTLEHLSLSDFRIALKNTYDLLENGGIFRCIVPDLEYAANKYIHDLKIDSEKASITFLEDIMLGINSRPKKFKDVLSTYFGNSHHLWMWDKYSLKNELLTVGFNNIRFCEFNDSKEKMFSHVEEKGRFINSICLEGIK
jgi:hypothetical protein